MYRIFFHPNHYPYLESPDMSVLEHESYQEELMVEAEEFLLREESGIYCPDYFPLNRCIIPAEDFIPF